MKLDLEPMGTLTVHTGGGSWNFSGGPIAGRSCTAFESVEWTSPYFEATSVWANGSYRNGPEIAEPNIRIMFNTDDGALLYLDYLARVHLPSNIAGESPSVLHGAVEIDETHRLAWLNRTALVGYGILDLTVNTMTYEMGVLRWPGDVGPRR